ncbi:Rne/Rng family ribonuclease [Mucisphaera calidilacus]|uniref:Ribonuclease G n=1 Tax=Mucisphaera calidilacus TaxID=2527982 RepID=A0A518BVI8_9BACT|nr:Rne/Rng family ribonuclease [Mucisphaera calidilacus]QDU70986.1 Ribonuclease E [Mucisphaera calidilacus]
MLINDVAGEECRIAIVNDGRLEEFYQERVSADSHVGNIYLGKVTNVEPSIQAAFVDFGLERNGFLHVSDLHPMYFPGEAREAFERVGVKTPRRERPPIQECLRKGSKIIVQVLKEGIGTKGPTLTSYPSIPGRYLVMMPHMKHAGVSRKVEDDDARREARQILKDLAPPEELGFIVRTAGIGQTKTELKRDLAYLTRLWKSIEKRKKKIRSVGELYEESDLIIRTLRDIYTTAIEEIVVDSARAAQRVADFLAVVNPRTKTRVFHYDDPIPLYHRHRIEEQIENISAREVPLKSGGSLVFDQAEALVAIDVNSGKSRDAKDAESNAFNTNAEAVEEIARQLRLRDLGGVIVADLIDMNLAKNRRTIESRFKALMKEDRARTRVGSISMFGTLELTRQRMRPSLRKSLYEDCPACNGSGQVKSGESVVLHVMRELAYVLHRENIARVELTISPDVAFQLLNRRRRQLVDLEKRYGKEVLVRVGGNAIDYVSITAIDDRGAQINMAAMNEALRKRMAQAPQLHEVIGRAAGIIEIEEEHEPQAEPETSAEQPAKEKGLSGSYLDIADDEEDDEGTGKKRRRRRRGGRRRRKSGDSDENEAGSAEPAAEERPEAETSEGEPAAAEPPSDDEDAPKKKRRRRRRRKSGETADTADQQGDQTSSSDDEREAEGEEAPAEPAPKPLSAREVAAMHARTARGVEPTETVLKEKVEDEAKPAEQAEADEEAPPKKKRTRRRSKKTPTKKAAEDQTVVDEAAQSDDTATDDTPAEDPPKKKKRTRRRSKKTTTQKATDEAPADAEPTTTGYANTVLAGETES